MFLWMQSDVKCSRCDCFPQNFSTYYVWWLRNWMYVLNTYTKCHSLCNKTIQAAKLSTTTYLTMYKLLMSVQEQKLVANLSIKISYRDGLQGGPLSSVTTKYALIVIPRTTECSLTEGCVLVNILKTKVHILGRAIRVRSPNGNLYNSLSLSGHFCTSEDTFSFWPRKLCGQENLIVIIFTLKLQIFFTHFSSNIFTRNFNIQTICKLSDQNNLESRLWFRQSFSTGYLNANQSLWIKTLFEQSRLSVRVC